MEAPTPGRLRLVVFVRKSLRYEVAVLLTVTAIASRKTPLRKRNSLSKAFEQDPRSLSSLDLETRLGREPKGQM